MEIFFCEIAHHFPKKCKSSEKAEYSIAHANFANADEILRNKMNIVCQLYLYTCKFYMCAIKWKLYLFANFSWAHFVLLIVKFGSNV